MKSKAIFLFTTLASFTVLSQPTTHPYSQPHDKIFNVECSGSLRFGLDGDPFSFRYDLGLMESKKVAEIGGYDLTIVQESGGINPFFVIYKGDKHELSLSLEEGLNRFKGVFAGNRGDRNQDKIRLDNLNCSVSNISKKRSEQRREDEIRESERTPRKGQVNIM